MYAFQSGLTKANSNTSFSRNYFCSAQVDLISLDFEIKKIINFFIVIPECPIH